MLLIKSKSYFLLLPRKSSQKHSFYLSVSFGFDVLRISSLFVIMERFGGHEIGNDPILATCEAIVCEHV